MGTETKQRVTLDFRTYDVLVDGTALAEPLTLAEWQIVERLSDGQVYTNDSLHYYRTGESDDLSDMTRWHIKHIRRKGIRVLNRSGFGYRLEQPAKIISREEDGRVTQTTRKHIPARGRLLRYA